jgi:hypothetical protein
MFVAFLVVESYRHIFQNCVVLRHILENFVGYLIIEAPYLLQNIANK